MTSLLFLIVNESVSFLFVVLLTDIHTTLEFILLTKERTNEPAS